MSKDKDRGKNKPSNLGWDLLRVRPDEPEDPKFYKTDRLTDYLIILFIFGIGFWFRFYFRDIFIAIYGNNLFDLKIHHSDPFGFGRFLGLNPGESAITEAYYDFFTYYIPYVDAFEEGWNPYTGSRVPDDKIGGYVYGPFYMVSIAIGKTWFGMTTIDSIVYSNIILDSLTYVMVYILAKRVTGNIIALVIALIGSFSPISLFYIAYRGLNAPIMNFSFLVFVWCYLEKKDKLTMFFLAFSLLTKQFPLFMAMPIGFWMVRRYGFFKGVGYYLQFFAWVLILSIPYILWTPRSYVVRLFIPGGSSTSMGCVEGNVATNLFYGFVPLEACFNSNGGIIPLQKELLPNMAYIMFDLVNSHVLFFGSLFLIAWIGFTGYDYLEERPRLYFVFIAAYFGIAHATIARGIYKYYITFLVPIFLLGLVMGNRNKSLHLRLGYQLNQAWRTWINPRYRQKEVNKSYTFYSITLTIATFGVIWLVLAAVKLFTFNTNTFLLWAIICVSIAIYTIVKPGPKPTFSETEVVDGNTYGRQIVGITPIIVLLSLFLSFIAIEYYFDGGSSALWNATIALVIMIAFVTLPLFQKQVTEDSKAFSAITFDPLQFALDGFGLLITIGVMIYFNRVVFLIHRYYTTLFLFFFSFMYLGMLGRRIWISAADTPINVIRRVFEIRRYTID